LRPGTTLVDFPQRTGDSVKRRRSESARCCLLLLFGLVSCLICFPSLAKGDGPRKREYVVTAASPLAEKHLESIADLIAAKQWNEAFTVGDLLLREHRDRLVRADEQRWISVLRRLAERIVALPPEGLTAYRLRVDSLTRPLLQEAERTADLSLYQQLIERYYASTVTDVALWRSGELLWRRGEIELARDAWRQLLPASSQQPDLRFPNPRYPAALVLSRLTLCDLQLGDFDSAKSRIAEIRKSAPNAAGAIGGKEGRYTDLLTDLLREREGQGTANGRGIRIGPLLWAHDDKTAVRERTRFVSTVPVLSGSWLVESNNSSIRVLNADTGKPAWPNGDPADDGAVFDVKLTESRPQSWPVLFHQPSLDEHGRLFARLGVGGRPNQLSLLRRDISQLAALDLQSGEGRVAWTAMTDQLPPETEWSFSSSPLALGGQVCTVVRGAGTESRLAVASFSVQDGRLLWLRDLCTVIAEQDPAWGREALTPAGDRLLVNLAGLVACLRVTDGAIQWVVQSQTDASENLSSDDAEGPYTSVISSGRVCVPMTGGQVFQLSLQDGRPDWSTVLPEPVTSIVSATGSQLVAAGESAWGLDSGGKVVWRFGFDDPEAHGAGRGAATGGDLFWCTEEDLFTLDARTGSPLHRIPLTNEFRSLRGGWVIVSPRHIAIASPAGIQVFQAAPSNSR
jgi:outer membrane protein assembly factor BamB